MFFYEIILMISIYWKGMFNFVEYLRMYNYMECDGFESKFICNVRDLRFVSILYLVVGV